ncbi:MAG: nuclear transport factor 2 family protein [Spirochaetaceae bacterium]|nr:nuclear transport factor 2 family protein [Myxococcales bacterium]MCB9722760.1 nuclear transport factor 2 family protein [Spirochaetaceae bacterium]HPG27595.1 nuclear transport factor 2 family protein [Myxococcota bacterium]
MVWRPVEPVERLDRLESLDEIRQLVAKYCLALDMRDLDALCGLFPEDVRVSRDLSGRRALKVWFDQTLREQFTGTAHVTGNHVIEFDDARHARGLVYSRNEHETGEAWVIMTMMYWDRYERVEDRWLFRRRLPLYWYATDLNAPPIGENKMRWPDRAPYEGGYARFWPSWERFWGPDYVADCDVPAPAGLDEFLARMAPRDEALSVRVR